MNDYDKRLLKVMIEYFQEQEMSAVTLQGKSFWHDGIKVLKKLLQNQQ
ncbi:MAG: hypothetical protein VKL60_00360 [Sphaerospermopsis sp.]|nr:hypothetical protein [Sphaerospermopsis sp.]